MNNLDDVDNEYEEALEFYQIESCDDEDCPCTCSHGCYNCLGISKGDFY